MMIEPVNPCSTCHTGMYVLAHVDSEEGPGPHRTFHISRTEPTVAEQRCLLVCELKRKRAFDYVIHVIIVIVFVVIIIIIVLIVVNMICLCAS